LLTEELVDRLCVVAGCGLHMRLIGHPARIKGLRDFLDYVSSFPDVWICKREEIAAHWIEHFPFTPSKETAAAKL
jgi:hypothetical protein